MNFYEEGNLKVKHTNHFQNILLIEWKQNANAYLQVICNFIEYCFAFNSQVYCKNFFYHIFELDYTAKIFSNYFLLKSVSSLFSCSFIINTKAHPYEHLLDLRNR